MPAITQWLLIAGNLVALAGGAVAFVRWLRNWLIKQVAQPMERIEIKLSSHDLEIKRAQTIARDAHKRIDRHLGNQHA